MAGDGFSNFAWGGLAAAIAAIAFLFLSGVATGREENHPSAVDKGLESEIAYQARIDFLTRIYSPVEEAYGRGEAQRALLKLEEINRRFPGEAHGYILKGTILHQLGALEEAVGSFVKGVKLNGDYIDQRSPLTRRADINRVVEDGLEKIGDRVRRNPGNSSAAAALKDVYYLQSRLAGGCE